MKKIIFLMSYLFIPSILYTICCFAVYPIGLIIFILLYVLSILGLILFFKYKPCSIWRLMTGLFLSIFVALIIDFNDPYLYYNIENFGYIHTTTYVYLELYLLPFLFIFLVLLGIKIFKKLI